jgi:5-methyltetrahydrofolate--homocysteine methyltransferase
MEIYARLAQALIDGDPERTAELTNEALRDRAEPTLILNKGLIAGMEIVGRKFHRHEIFLPDVLLAAKAMYAGMDLLKPLLSKGDTIGLGKIVLGTVQGDLHDIGKNLVGILLKGAGVEVIDLGHDVPPEEFIRTANENNADIIGLSALLTTTMPAMKKTIDLAKASGIYGRIKIIIGGAPVTAEYAAEIGADAYCFDGMKAVECVKKILAGR